MGPEGVVVESGDTAMNFDRQRMEIVEAKGRVWGWQWRKNFGDKVSVPVASILGKIQDEAFGAGEGSISRNYAEVFLGDALEFATALKHLPEDKRQFAYVHYCIPQPAKVKAHELGIHQRTYWQRRNAMRMLLAHVMNV